MLYYSKPGRQNCSLVTVTALHCGKMFHAVTSIGYWCFWQILQVIQVHVLIILYTIQALLLLMDPATPLLNSTQITKLNQIIVWSSVMWMWMILQCITVTHGTALLKSTYHSDSQHDKNLLTAHIHFCFLPADSVTIDTVYEYNQTHLHRADSNSRCFLCVRTEENLHRSLHLIQDTLQHCVYRSIQKIL